MSKRTLMALAGRLQRRVARAVLHRWRMLCSRFLQAQMQAAGGRVYIGRHCALEGLEYMTCRGNFQALERNRIEAIAAHRGIRYNPVIIFGNNVSMENDCHIGAVNRVEIHDNVLIASRVYISDHAHGVADYPDIAIAPNERPVWSKGPVIIEHDVWIGEGACILPGVTVGHNAIVGANAVVTRDVPPFSVVGGVPARVVKAIRPPNNPATNQNS
jgi:acetyltransferase-like isoleucine patch superfamily enzyme